MNSQNTRRELAYDDMRYLEATLRGKPLSEREIDILTRVAFGFQHKEIARTLHLSTQTVKNHVTNILRKLGATNSANAVYLFFVVQDARGKRR